MPNGESGASSRTCTRSASLLVSCADEGVLPVRLVLNQRRDRGKTREGESKVDGDEDHHGEDRRGGAGGGEGTRR